MTVTLCLYCSPDVQPEALGSTPSGLFRGPPRSGVAFPSTSGLYCLEVCWQLHRGFLRTSSVGCGLPYHISSLTLWESAGNCIGGFPSAPSVGCGLPYHIWSLLSRILLATASGVSEVPLGRVWPSLPHLVSNPLGVCWQLLWDPNSTELNNNSTPTRSPTGSLNRMFNRHQAEITVMQFRGYSLPVHDCSGTMRPSLCPIS